MLVFIEIALCLTLIYALGAMVCSVIHESVAQVFALRWRSLEAALHAMLAPAEYARFTAHPLIARLWDGPRRPTLIPELIAARAMVHAFEPPDQAPLTDATRLLATLPVGLQRRIVPFLNQPPDQVQALYDAAQTWFSASMTAASDWYARQAYWISIAVACTFALALNIDTLAIASRLAQQPLERVALMQLAQEASSPVSGTLAGLCAAENGRADASPTARLTECIAALTSGTGDLIGWNAAVWRRSLSGAVWQQLLGWLVSGLAMSLGARFWFDVLSRLVSVRAGMAPATAAAAGKKAPA